MMRALRYIGTIIALSFIGYVLWRSAADMPAIDFSSGKIWLGFTVGLLLYTGSQFVGAAAWRATLNLYSVQLPGLRAESQLLVSQIGKYIPGNIAHFLGRFGLARSDGVEASVIAGSMLLEIGFLMATGTLIVGTLLLTVPEFVTAITANLHGQPLALSVTVFIPVLLACISLASYLIWRKAGKPSLAPSKLLRPLLLHGVNFAVLGTSLWCVAFAIQTEGNISVLSCIAIFTTAWVAGFLMPGAPGGIGVRDGIIALGLGLFIGPGPGLSTAVIHRFISVLGDLPVFGIGVLLRRKT